MKKVNLFVIIAVCAYFLVAIGFYVGHNTKGTVVYDTPHLKGTFTATGEYFKIDINDCDYYDLMSLEGIGEVLAKRIVAYRWENGDYKSIGELLQVKGMTQRKLEAIQDQITTGDGS